MKITLSLIALLMSISTMAASKQIKVLTLNVGALAPFAKITDQKTLHRLHGICRKLDRSDYDVVFIQEAWTKEYREVLKGCGFPYYSDPNSEAGIFRKLENDEISTFKIKALAHTLETILPNDIGFDTGLLTLSRYPLQSLIPYRFSKNGEEEMAIDDGEFPVSKGMDISVIMLNKENPVLLFNTHMVAEYETHSYLEQRIQQVREASEIISEYDFLNYPIIFAGDFNMSPPTKDGSPRALRSDSAWIETRDTYLREFKQLDISDQIKTTFRTNKEVSEGVIDHIFTKGNLKTISSELDFKGTTFCGTNEESQTIENCYYSDHFGVNAVIEVKELK